MLSAYFASLEITSLKIKWLLFRRSLDRFWVHHTRFFVKPAHNAAPTNLSRRKLLKIAGLGLGALVVGKIVGHRLIEPLARRETSPGLAEAEPRAGKGTYWKQTFLFSD